MHMKDTGTRNTRRGIEMSSKEYCDKCEFEITELDERHLIDSSGKCNPNMYDSPIILCQNCCKYEESK